jgi:hypothetical protein
MSAGWREPHVQGWLQSSLDENPAPIRPSLAPKLAGGPAVLAPHDPFSIHTTDQSFGDRIRTGKDSSPERVLF